MDLADVQAMFNSYTLMKTYSIVLVIILVVLKITTVQSICPIDNYIIIDGIKECFKCQYCPEGEGLYPACGSRITEFQKRDITCRQCVAGTYSDEYGPSSCKSCSICHPKENVTRSCTVDKNALCSNKCQRGFYFDNITTHECQRCSYCCNDGNDVKIEECVAHGLERRQCSIQHYCTPKPQYTDNPTAPSITLSTSTRETGVNNKGLVIGLSVAAVIIIGVTCAVICYFRCCRGSTITDRSLEGETSISLLPAECHCCSALRNEASKLNLSIVPCSDIKEGQNVKIEILISEPNQNIDLEKCDIHWTKDGKTLENRTSKTLNIESIKILDFGLYKCEITCKEHHAEGDPLKCGEIFLDVKPCEGKRYNCLRNVFSGDMELKLEEQLVSDEKWRKIAIFLGMEDIKIKNLQSVKSFDAAKETVDFMCSSTNKNVYEFLRFAKQNGMSEMVDEVFKQNDVLSTDDQSSPAAASTEESRPPPPENQELLDEENEKATNRYRRSRSLSYESHV